MLKVGNRVSVITDTEYISGRELGRSWLAADEDGVMADYLVFDEEKLCRIPDYLDWLSASVIPCAGVTAWSALKGMSIGQTVLIQGKPSSSFFFFFFFFNMISTKAREESVCLLSNLRERQDCESY